MFFLKAIQESLLAIIISWWKNYGKVSKTDSISRTDHKNRKERSKENKKN